MSKVYLIGGTGGIGSQVVRGLLERGVETTILARDSNKAVSLFGKPEKLNVVQGDYEDLDNYKSTIAGHDRLFILISGFKKMIEWTGTVARLAYESGVKQVIFISSSQSLSPAWRSNAITDFSRQCEEAIYKIPNRGYFVALRPSSFFTNHFFGDDKTVRAAGFISGAMMATTKRAWISTTDIALAAVNIMTDSVEKHEDAAYEMTTQRLSGNDRAEILSRILGKEIKYVELSPAKEYENIVNRTGMPHVIAYGLVDYSAEGIVNRALPIILGREPETLEDWLKANKEKFQ